MKKATFFTMMLLLFSLSSYSQSDKQEMNGLFEGWNGKVYSFSYGDDEYVYFAECDQSVLKSFDLNGDDMLYEMFRVSYVSHENDQGEKVNKIVGLVLIESED